MKKIFKLIYYGEKIERNRQMSQQINKNKKIPQKIQIYREMQTII